MIYLLLCSLFAAFQPLLVHAHANSSGSKSDSQQTLAVKDGQHDFDFGIGTWKTRLTRLSHPLTGSTTWIEYERATVVRRVRNARTNLGEHEAEGRPGLIHVVSVR